MSPTALLSEMETVLTNQTTILENQALILKNQDEIKKSQRTLNVIVKNQEEILAALYDRPTGTKITKGVEEPVQHIGGVFTKKGG